MSPFQRTYRISYVMDFKLVLLFGTLEFNMNRAITYLYLSDTVCAFGKAAAYQPAAILQLNFYKKVLTSFYLGILNYLKKCKPR